MEGPRPSHQLCCNNQVRTRQGSERCLAVNLIHDAGSALWRQASRLDALMVTSDDRHLVGLAGLEPSSKLPRPLAASNSPLGTSMFMHLAKGAFCGVRTVGDTSDSVDHWI